MHSRRPWRVRRVKVLGNKGCLFQDTGCFTDVNVDKLANKIVSPIWQILAGGLLYIGML